MKRRIGRDSSRYGECTISSGTSILRSDHCLLDALLFLLVGDDRDREQPGRVQRLRVRERFEHAAVHGADEHDDGVVHAARLEVVVGLQALGDRRVVRMDRRGTT